MRSPMQISKGGRTLRVERVAEERVDGEGGGMEMVQMVAEVALVPVRYGVVESGEKNLTVVGVKMARQLVPRRGAMARRS